MTDRECCITLNMISGVGFVKYTALTEHFGGAARVREASEEELREVPGIGPQLAARIRSYDWEGAYRAEQDLAERAGVRILTLLDENYPQILRSLYDPPLCLYVRGHLPEFPDNAVAIVGSRRMSGYGERMTRQIASEAAAAGFVVVSGLAFGVDTAAHQATVECAGVTVAVLGGGLMHIHPQENVPLARAIVERGGALISEFPMNFPVSRTSFPRRNRIVAGLCRGTIVVEAGIQSGAMITARLALENGREVFAVPGHADNPQAQGCHKLIKEGAGLVETFDDVLNAFGMGFLPGLAPEMHDSGPAYVPGSNGDLTPDMRIILSLLKNSEATFDELSANSALESGALQSALTRLELMLAIERGSDLRYRLVR